MRAETNLCIMREADQKVGRVLVPVDGGAGSGWVMVGRISCPGPGYLRVGYTFSSSKPAEPRLLHLAQPLGMRCTVSMRDSVGLAWVVSTTAIRR